MNAQANTGGAKPASPVMKFLTAKEAAQLYGVSISWLAKRRMSGDGPPFVKVGRSVRYTDAGLLQWAKSRQRLSTGRAIGPVYEWRE
jgi:predicted DNA-binding transcriptional regulator AlpA